jgi:hypothetical protein
VNLFSPLLLAAVTVVGGGLASPAAAQRVEVFVNGQRVTDIVINGKVSNGAEGYVDDAAGFGGAADGLGYVDDAIGGNGTQYGFVDGANAGNGLSRGIHSQSHVGPYDECFRDRLTGTGYCTGRYGGRHSGPHRGLYRGNARAPLF